MEPSLRAGYKILSELIAPKPLYIVSAAGGVDWPMDETERKFCNFFAANSIGFTSPINDFNFKRHSLKYQWRGRGCCVAFCSPPGLMSEREAMGVLLHEVAHWVDDFDRPERDEPDNGRAFDLWWNGLKKEGDPHGPRWFKACVNLWHRVTAGFGYELPFTAFYDPQLHWNGSREQLASLLDEASRRENEPVESILASSAVAVPGSGVARPPAGTARQEPTWPRYDMIGRQLVVTHQDGSIEIPGGLGETPRRYSSYQAYLKEQRQKLRAA